MGILLTCWTNQTVRTFFNDNVMRITVWHSDEKMAEFGSEVLYKSWAIGKLVKKSFGGRDVVLQKNGGNVMSK